MFIQGTSMAAAHVTGAAALVDANAGGSRNAAQIKRRLLLGSDDLGRRGNDPAYGRGRLNVLGAVTR